MLKEIQTIVILGNGFDISHSIPSGYNDFKNYIKKKYNFDEKDFFPTIYAELGVHGRINICEEESAKALFYGIESSLNNDWSKFEQDLAHMDFSDLIPTLNEFIGVDNEDDYSYYSQVYENYIYDFISIIDFWKDIFNEWINEVNEKIVKLPNTSINPLFTKLFKENTIVFSFNYTETVERLYCFNNIIHIHNKVGDKLVWGHGEKIKNINKMYTLDNKLCGAIVLNEYKKDTQKQIKKFRKFFDNLKDRTITIYSYGFGYSDVDLIYIKKIINNINVNSEWYLFDYNNSFAIQEQILKDCGFTGKIYQWY